MSIRMLGSTFLLPLSLLFLLGTLIFNMPETAHSSMAQQSTMPYTHTTILTTPVPIDLPTPMVATFIIGNPDSSPIDVVPGQIFTMMVMIDDPIGHNLATTTVQINYDDSLFRVVSCNADPDREFNLGQCNQAYQSNAIKFNVTSLSGIAGNVNIAEIEWEVLDVPGGSTLIELDIITAGVYPDVNSPHKYRIQNQVINIAGNPLVSIGNQNGSAIVVAIEETFELPIRVFDISDNPIAVADLTVTYDSSIMEPIACESHPGSPFEDITCDFDSEPGIIRLSGAAPPDGIYGDVDLASITWHVFRPPVAKTTISIDAEKLLDPRGNLITAYATQDQTINIILDNIPNILIGNRDNSTIRVVAGDTFTLPVEILDISPYNPIGGVSIELYYDPTYLEPRNCENHPNADFAKVQCNLDFTPGTIRLNGISKVGASGDVRLAVIEWEVIGKGGVYTDLSPYPIEVINTAGHWMDAIYQQQPIQIMPRGDVNCDNRLSILDALFILQYNIDLRSDAEQCGPEKEPAETVYLPACDISDDKNCDPVDALFILRCDVGFPSPLCPEDNPPTDPKGTILENNTLPDGGAAARLYIEYPTIATSSTFTATVRVDSEAKLGALTASLAYDMDQFRAITCQMAENEGDSSGVCNLNEGENRVHFNTAMPAGASGSRHLVDITFEHIGTTIDMSAFTLAVSTVANLQGDQLSFTVGKEAMIYLPIIQQ